MNATVLIVDDEKNLRRLTADYLTSGGFTALTASNGLSGQKILIEDPVDAVVLDLKMPGMDGLELLQWIRDKGPDIPVLMISAFGDIEDAVGAMKLGASDYLVKPFDPEELLLKLRRTLETSALRRQAEFPAPFAPSAHPASSNPSLQQMETLIRKAAPTDTTILITGESGTGKEVAARRIHQISTRAEAPFIPINLGGIPEALLESELFGYEKGAFTGADRRKPGQFEMASGGTLFLDEIGEMPLSLQVKLLRVLQERKILRLGGTTPLPMDVRIIAATNRSLPEEVEAKRFREDLYYRLNVIHLEIPPLRDRPEEIEPLARQFLGENAKKLSKPLEGFSQEALRALQGYSFPGNIRELENLIERAAILSDSPLIQREELTIPHQPEELSPPPPAPPSPPRGTLKGMEKSAIREALLRNEGKRGAAAAELGISRRTLLNKIKEYQLEEKAP